MPNSVPTVSVVWPSRKRYLSYLYDASSIAWSQGYIDSLLLALVEKSDNITLVAHSMGGRALVGAIRRLNLAKPRQGGACAPADPRVTRYRSPPGPAR